MPKYFIDTATGGTPLRDTKGLDLSSREEARDLAVRSLTEMANDLCTEDDSVLYADVRDEAGQLIYTASLLLTGRWIGQDENIDTRPPEADGGVTAAAPNR